MNDIVEMLRQGSLTRDDYRWKAADEIERLQNELHIAQEWSARVIAGHEEDIRDVTRLTAALAHADELNARRIARVKELEGALRLAFPVIDEAFRWHRDTQSAPSINETVRVLEAVRAALTQPAERGGEP
jgi:hypothetical protein